MVDGHHTFVERPKVIYNPRTKKFVMWMHLEHGRYLYARAGIAVSDTPTGPFTFIKAIRPIDNTNDFTSEESDPAQQKKFGGTFRDMNLFVDDDGSAYVFYSSEDNWTMYVVRLDDDFTGPKVPAAENKTWARILIRRMRERVSPFKWNGKYYLITFGTHMTCRTRATSGSRSVSNPMERLPFHGKIAGIFPFLKRREISNS